MHSLLWRDARPPHEQLAAVNDAATDDLELEYLSVWIAGGRADKQRYIRDALMHPPRDAALIRWRAAITEDLMQSPRSCDGLESAARELRRLAQHRPERFPPEVSKATRIGARLVELESYVSALHALAAALTAPTLTAEAFRRLREDVQEALRSPGMEALQETLPRLRDSLNRAHSITIGINVSPALEPESAVLIGFSDAEAQPAAGVMGLVSGPDTVRKGLVRLFRREPVDWFGTDHLAQGVRALLDAVAAPVERALSAYRSVGAQGVAHLEDEILLMTGAARMAREWHARGMPWCTASIVERGAKAWMAQDAFHPVLMAKRQSQEKVVLNDLTFGRTGAVWILTGPNRGGKTTYLRTAALIQLLGQNGLPVPAKSAALWAADAIYTHFPVAEAGEPGQGRLDEEAKRMARIFQKCTADSLVLLNEVLAGTSAPEGVALAIDILRGFRALGCNVIYATHLHDLAARTQEMNDTVKGNSEIGNLTVTSETRSYAGAIVRHPTYRVIAGQPQGPTFFASEIAARHGITLHQIMDSINQRGLGNALAGQDASGSGDPSS